LGGPDDPSRHLGDVPVELRGLAYGFADGAIGCGHPAGVEVPEALLQKKRSQPRPLGGNSLVEDDGAEEGERIRPDELVGVGVRREVKDRPLVRRVSHGAELATLVDLGRQAWLSDLPSPVPVEPALSLT
jgi:hypothetical protein